MSYNIITANVELIQFCNSLKTQSFVTIDTEFLREKTYFAKLCLVQIAAGDDDSLVAAIDSLASDIDLSPLLELLVNPSITKVFHAARQDIEIFYHLLGGKLPNNVFDTQIAAGFCGLGEQIGYENIASQLLGKAIDKSQQFTDWAVRPLSDKQISYAIADVTYLREIYIILRDEKLSNDRFKWATQEINDNLLDKKLYAINVDNAWERIKKRSNKPAGFIRLRELAKWREQQAVAQNKPRRWIFHDDAITEVANTNANNIEKLKRVRAINKSRSRINLDDILNVVNSANNMLSNNEISKEDLPQISKNNRLPAELESAQDFLKLLLKLKCREHKISPALVASSNDIAKYLMSEGDVQFMSSWRYDIFGQYVENAMQGKISLSIDDKSKNICIYQD